MTWHTLVSVLILAIGWVGIGYFIHYILETGFLWSFLWSSLVWLPLYLKYLAHYFWEVVDPNEAVILGSLVKHEDTPEESQRVLPGGLYAKGLDETVVARIPYTKMIQMDETIEVLDENKFAYKVGYQITLERPFERLIRLQRVGEEASKRFFKGQAEKAIQGKFGVVEGGGEKAIATIEEFSKVCEESFEGGVSTSDNEAEWALNAIHFQVTSIDPTPETQKALQLGKQAQILKTSVEDLTKDNTMSPAIATNAVLSMSGKEPASVQIQLGVNGLEGMTEAQKIAALEAITRLTKGGKK